MFAVENASLCVLYEQMIECIFQKRYRCLMTRLSSSKLECLSDTWHSVANMSLTFLFQHFYGKSPLCIKGGCHCFKRRGLWWHHSVQFHFRFSPFCRSPFNMVLFLLPLLFSDEIERLILIDAFAVRVGFVFAVARVKIASQHPFQSALASEFQEFLEKKFIDDKTKYTWK